MLLGKPFSGVKWRALLLLVLGCVLVASPAFNKKCDIISKGSTSSTTSNSGNTDDENVTMLDAKLGIFAILCMVTISGYTAVYFESMLKKEKITVWERNFQLAFYSSIFISGIIISERSYTTSPPVMFEGWTVSAFLLATIQAGGGLLVAATLKYADSILKTLATSGSIVLSAVLGYMLIDGALDIFVSIGCVSTILAIVNYSLDNTPAN
jgi:UDP-sugar transporter A1/2/3